MEVIERKIKIDVCIEGTLCGNCYWMDFTKKKHSCRLFNKKLKCKDTYYFRRCKKCIKTYGIIL